MDVERAPILFRAKLFEVLVVGLLGEDANIEADFIRAYCLGQLAHLYENVDVVAVYDAKEIRKDSKGNTVRKKKVTKTLTSLSQ